MSSSGVRPHRVAGLDSIRFVCALIVACGHIPLPLVSVHPSDTLFWKMAGLLNGCFFNGPAAVVAFFVISGFCIHYPNISGRDLDPLQFYTRRFLRIGIPALVALAMYRASGVDIAYPTYGVLWSVICEAIYYLLYPAFLWINARGVSWTILIAASFVLAMGLGLTHLDLLTASTNSFNAFGMWTWVIGLPSWLMGCWLAENWGRFPALGWKGINAVRLAVLATSIVLRVTKFHGPALIGSNVLTMNVFAFLVTAWLGLEITRFMRHAPNRQLEWAGQWSYSLYLCHMVPAALFMGDMRAASLGKNILILISALLLSLLFYRIVEMPSHRFAAATSRRLRAFKSPVAT